MRLSELLGEQHVRSAEEWNRVIDNSIDFQPQKDPIELPLGGL